MIERGSLSTFALSVAALCGLLLAFTLVIDTYGVSPVRLNLAWINTQKPKRLDIDRVIKPYEVWRYQPRTVFCSAPHKSIKASTRPFLMAPDSSRPTTLQFRRAHWQ